MPLFSPEIVSLALDIMYTIITKIRYEYAHRLIYHQGKCRHVHGHSGKATIELAADILNENGFVMDFAEAHHAYNPNNGIQIVLPSSDKG